MHQMHQLFRDLKVAEITPYNTQSKEYFGYQLARCSPGTASTVTRAVRRLPGHPNMGATGRSCSKFVADFIFREILRKS